MNIHRKGKKLNHPLFDDDLRVFPMFPLILCAYIAFHMALFFHIDPLARSLWIQQLPAADFLTSYYFVRFLFRANLGYILFALVLLLNLVRDEKKNIPHIASYMGAIVVLICLQYFLYLQLDSSLNDRILRPPDYYQINPLMK